MVLPITVCGFAHTKTTPSEQASQRTAKRISGAKIIVLDELSITSLEGYYKQHIAYSRALSTLTECPIEKNTLHTPFGRLHVILVVDFYQL